MNCIENINILQNYSVDSIQVAVLSIQVAVLSIQVAVLSIQVTVLSIWNDCRLHLKPSWTDSLVETQQWTI